MGEIRISKGCFSKADHNRLGCTQGKIQGTAGFYSVNCCKGNLCNNETVSYLDQSGSGKTNSFDNIKHW